MSNTLNHSISIRLSRDQEDRLKKECSEYSCNYSELARLYLETGQFVFDLLKKETIPNILLRNMPIKEFLLLLANERVTDVFGYQPPILRDCIIPAWKNLKLTPQQFFIKGFAKIKFTEDKTE